MPTYAGYDGLIQTEPPNSTRVTLPNGTEIRLLAIQVTYFRDLEHKQSEFFSPKTLQPISDHGVSTSSEESIHGLFERVLKVGDIGIALHFEFDSTVSIIAGDSYDIARKSRISRNAYSPGEGKSLAFVSSRWSGAPIGIAVTFVSGDPEISEVPLEVGRTIQSAHGYQHRILGIKNGTYRRTGNLRDQIFQRTNTREDNPISVFLQHSNPRNGSEVSLFALKTGQPPTAVNGSLTSQITVHRLDGNAGFEALRFERRKVHKILWRFDRVPGLPEECHGLTNLLSAPIPAVEFQDFRELRDFFYWSYNLDSELEEKTPSLMQSFPKTYQDITASEILADLNKHFSGSRIEIWWDTGTKGWKYGHRESRFEAWRNEVGDWVDDVLK